MPTSADRNSFWAIKAGIAGRGFVVLEAREATVRRGGAYTTGLDRETEQKLWEKIRDAERKRKELGGEDRGSGVQRPCQRGAGMRVGPGIDAIAPDLPRAAMNDEGPALGRPGPVRCDLAFSHKIS